MELQKAIEAVDQERSGKRVRFTWDEWDVVENVLREAGDECRANFAHGEKMRAYHKEEWDAGLL